MAQQEFEVVFEDALDALRSAVRAIGGAKVAGRRLYPGKPQAQAHRDVLDALNPERERKFDIHEVIQILKWAREAGFHSAKHYLDLETGYERSAPRERADELAELQRAYIQSVEQQGRLVERIERLQQVGARPPLQAIEGNNK